jgi:hypothetical protein
MKQEEILAMMHNVIANNTHYTTWTVSTPHLVALVNQAVELEREACRTIAADYAQKHNSMTAVNIADAIRARGQE